MRPNKRIAEWFAAGNTGCATDIAQALELAKRTVYGNLVRMEARREITLLRVEAMGKGGGRYIYGRTVKQPEMLRTALAMRSPLERGWA